MALNENDTPLERPEYPNSDQACTYCFVTLQKFEAHGSGPLDDGPFEVATEPCNQFERDSCRVSLQQPVEPQTNTQYRNPHANHEPARQKVLTPKPPPRITPT